MIKAGYVKEKYSIFSPICYSVYWLFEKNLTMLWNHAPELFLLKKLEYLISEIKEMVKDAKER